VSPTHAVDPVALARDLIRCPSVTPRDGGALDVVQRTAESLGFVCHRLPFSDPGADTIDNLYARRGEGAPLFCFAGHTDVVPVGEESAWRFDPFGGEVAEATLYGRGAADMKSAIACFLAAVERFTEDGGAGAIALLITGDEEGAARNGTRKVLSWMNARGEALDVCLVGEPTNPSRLGEMVKIGRRGSLTGRLTVQGKQGHVAYPHLADNPIPRLIAVLARLSADDLDHGNAHFQPSNLEVTTVDVGNPATNVIPASVRATFNIRFNDEHSGATLSTWLREICRNHAGSHELEIEVSGEAFLTPPGRLTDLVSDSIERVLGQQPELSTTGGTSDARFIKELCPVVEFGMVGATMHAVDECVAVADIHALTEVYTDVLKTFFQKWVS
jgi:succinyl-diaminopimelate desuccinylase